MASITYPTPLRAGGRIEVPAPSMGVPAHLLERLQTSVEALTTPRSVGLLGFSQGGAMVLQMMRRSPGVFAYGVQLGGFVVNDTQLGDGALRSGRLPVSWGRGAHDGVIPAAAVRRTAMFSALHLSITERVYRDLGHDVAGREVTDLAAFVTDQIARR